MTLASINPKHTYIDNVRKFHEFEKLNKKMYGMLKRDKKEKCVRTWL